MRRGSMHLWQMNETGSEAEVVEASAASEEDATGTADMMVQGIEALHEHTFENREKFRNLVFSIDSRRQIQMGSDVTTEEREKIAKALDAKIHR